MKDVKRGRRRTGRTTPIKADCLPLDFFQEASEP